MDSTSAQHLAEIPLYKKLYSNRLPLAELTPAMEPAPLLEKKHITEGFPINWMTESLKSALANDELEFTTTSGTTSDRMQVMRRKQWWRGEYRRTYRHNPYLSQFSLEDGKKAILTTAVCSSSVCYLEHPSYKDRILGNTLYLNVAPDPNNWKRSDIERITDELNTYAPEYLDADPVYLSFYLKKKQEFGVSTEVRLPKYMTLSYELVTRACRRFIRQNWNIPTFNLYGTTETGYLYCEGVDGKLKRCPESSSVEFVPFDESRNIYYLIVTSLKNEFMPLIRYKIGDLVKVDAESMRAARATGNYEQVQIEYFCGREKDLTHSEQGTPITPGELDHALGNLDNGLFLYQLCALSHQHLMLRYMTVSGESLPSNELARVRDCLHQLYGPQMNIQFAHEKAIAPERSGKFAITKVG
ncbi:hypothetical protein [Stigmatella aurantiaca]|uniref:Conserved uncharacterized protein n=1 Tax=Stigmatella aurantiaca (strain DW4/3-1) TaxID=378806 RepID=Q095N5_STIAD|nr:hypothetical protein [Stigmatella aurantiaca]ADO68342.1 conserved uncharacterized protein [Stigmatella aurantiaca DW4/3-1]EAU67453.1 conserved hypothetical protein [Stigmatella aurantiaca DW4/3-1]